MTSPSSPAEDIDNLFGEASSGGSDTGEEVSAEPKVARVKATTLARHARSHRTSYVSSMRVPTFMSIDPHPFSSRSFLEKFNKDQPLQNENALRWRYARGSDGHVARRSNARIVEWSDGSRTLQLGGEQFELHVSKQPNPDFLCENYGEQGVLQTRAVIHQTLRIIPTSIQSDTHRLLALSVARRQNRGQVKVGSVVTTEDPEKVQRDLERAELMKQRARRKLESQREAAIRYTERRSSSNRYSSYDGELEEEDDDELDEDVEMNGEMEEVEEAEEEEEEGEERSNGSGSAQESDDEDEKQKMKRLQSVKNKAESDSDHDNTEDERPARRREVMDDDSD